MGYAIKLLENEIKMRKKILADKNWATGPYSSHKEIRSEMEEKLQECIEALKILKENVAA